MCRNSGILHMKKWENWKIGKWRLSWKLRCVCLKQWSMLGLQRNEDVDLATIQYFCWKQDLLSTDRKLLKSQWSLVFNLRHYKILYARLQPSSNNVHFIFEIQFQNYLWWTDLKSSRYARNSMKKISTYLPFEFTIIEYFCNFPSFRTHFNTADMKLK